MRTIRSAFRRASWAQRLLWVTVTVLFAAGVLGVLVPYFGGTWVSYFFAVLPFVVSAVFVLASHDSGKSDERDHTPAPNER